MSLSNRHTLHHHRLLQAVYALHPSHYALLSNCHAINPQLRMTQIYLNMENLIPTIHSPIVLPTVDPLSTSLAPVIPLPRQAHSAKPKMVWKLGRGAIEKVDKITGEIMHLVEERAVVPELALMAA